MKKFLLMFLAVAVWVSAAQAAVITSPSGNNVNPDNFGRADMFNVTFNSTPYEDLNEQYTYVSIDGSIWAPIDSSGFSVTSQAWAGGSGSSTVQNLDGLFGLNAGELEIVLCWSISDMYGPEGGATYTKSVCVRNYSGSPFSDVSVIEYIDYDIVDSGAQINRNTGDHYPWDTLGQYSDPNDYGSAAYRGYLAWCRETLSSYEIDGAATVQGHALSGSLDDLPTGLYWNGQGVGPAELAMGLEHDYGALADSAETGPIEYVVQIPEPTTYALMALGLAGVVAYRRKKS